MTACAVEEEPFAPYAIALARPGGDRLDDDKPEDVMVTNGHRRTQLDLPLKEGGGGEGIGWQGHGRGQRGGRA